MESQTASEGFGSTPLEQRARVKVLDPLTSIGPSIEADLLSSSPTDLQLRVPRWIVPGSTVQVLASNGVVFGKVWLATEVGSTFEIEVAIEPVAF